MEWKENETIIKFKNWAARNEMKFYSKEFWADLLEGRAPRRKDGTYPSKLKFPVIARITRDILNSKRSECSQDVVVEDFKLKIEAKNSKEELGSLIFENYHYRIGKVYPAFVREFYVALCFAAAFGIENVLYNQDLDLYKKIDILIRKGDKIITVAVRDETKNANEWNDKFKKGETDIEARTKPYEENEDITYINGVRTVKGIALPTDDYIDSKIKEVSDSEGEDIKLYSKYKLEPYITNWDKSE